MKRNLHFFSVLLFLLCSMQIFAQELTITGKVVDEDKMSLPGVTVVVDGTQKGTITDIDGNFSVKVNSGEVLVFSFIGFKDQKISITDQTQVDVQLESSVIGLDEVVAVGYGTMKKSDLTGSVVSVSAEKLKGLSLSNADQMLKGRMAGVQVTQNSGAPGGSASIRIRGASSIGNSNEPLYIIDGVQVSGEGTEIGGFDWAGGTNGQNRVNPLSTISPSDIESIDVLKDASACAVYGAAGANGVVIVKTKRGKKGDTKITYDGYMAIQSVAKTLDMMNLREFAQYQNELSEFLQTDVDEAFADPSILGEGTDWQDEIFRVAPMQSHQLSLTGGSEKVTYAISGGYLNQDGIIFGSGFERYNSRINVDGKVNDFIKMGGSLALSRTDEVITRQDGTDGVLLQALTMQPSVPVYNFDGSWAGPGEVYGASMYNPLWIAKQQSNTLVRNRVMGNTYLSFDILEGLNIRSEFGYDISNNQNKAFIPTYDFGIASSDLNKMLHREDNSIFWQWVNNLNYKFTLAEKHNFNINVVGEVSKSEWDGISIIKQGFTTDDIFVMTKDGQFISNDGWQDGATSGAFFGRVFYNFADRYMLTATYRGDGSSKFGADNKWGFFPSAAFAWRISNESFMQSVNEISNLKLRFSYGAVGNSNIGTYKYGSAMKALTSPLGTAYRLRNVSNPKIKWEASEQYTLALELGLFKSRVNLVLEAYQKSTKDLLMQVSIPSYLGDLEDNDGIAAPFVNIGKTQNRGFDIALNTVNIQNTSFDWATDVTFSINYNEVIALNDDAQVLYGKIDWWSEFATASAIMVGQPMGVYYGYKVDRLFRNEQDILNSSVQVADPNNKEVNLYNKKTGVYVGDIKFQDLNGDGVIDDNDQTVIGDPNPDFTFGFNNRFVYKQLDLAIGVDGSYGGDILNFSRYRTESMTSIWDNQSQKVGDRAQVGVDDSGNTYLLNPESDMPRPATNDFNRNTRMSDRWIEDGSYIRLSSITLGYKLPENWISKVKLRSAKVYATVQNVYTWTTYSGYDPEIGAYNQSALLQNIDRGRYPTPRTYTVGVNISF